MKTKKIYSNVFSIVINKIYFAAFKAEDAILHNNNSNPIVGFVWEDKFAQDLFNKYVPDELLEQAKIDNTIAEQNIQTWISSMRAYERPRCYIDKVGIGVLIQHCLTKKTALELKACQKKMHKDYAVFYYLKNKEEAEKKLILSVNWRLQKLFPNDRVIKQATNNNLYQKYILDDDQIDFIAQNYMDLVRHGWVYK